MFPWTNNFNMLLVKNLLTVSSYKSQTIYLHVYEPGKARNNHIKAKPKYISVNVKLFSSLHNFWGLKCNLLGSRTFLQPLSLSPAALRRHWFSPGPFLFHVCRSFDKLQMNSNILVSTLQLRLHSIMLLPLSSWGLSAETQTLLQTAWPLLFSMVPSV